MEVQEKRCHVGGCMNNLNSVLLDVCISNSIYCNELSVYGHDLNRG